MATASQGTEEIAAVGTEFRATPAGLLARAGVASLIALVVFLVPLMTNTTWDNRISLAAIFAIVGLSINVLTGYAGHVSLGHQGLVGIGAFVSAFIARPSLHASFFVALPIAGLSGAVVAGALGLVALRIRGLHLALVTLAFGLMAQHTIFNIRQFSGGLEGVPAPRPGGFHSNQAYAYLCLLFLGLFLLVDWRMAKTKAGRAFVALRSDERAAAVLGINVTGYKLLAFTVSGFLAGVAGSLFAHQAQFVYPSFFDFGICLIWLLMTVVGGLGSRSGVVVGSAFFALFPFLLTLATQSMGFHFDVAKLASYTPLLAALLALLTLIRFHGGIGAMLLPARRWLAGGRLWTSTRRAATPEPAADGQTDVRASTIATPPTPRAATRRRLAVFRRRSRR